MRLPSTLLALLALSLTAHADNLIVDDNGGVGVDYTNMVDAVAAANVGDRLYVHPGSYFGHLASDKGMTIIGVGPGVFLGGGYAWHDLPANQELRVVGLELGQLIIQDCAGPVMLAELEMNDHHTAGGYLWATRCDDVRLRDCTIRSRISAAVSVEDSRVELVSCDVLGSAGFDGNFVEAGGDGGDAVVARAGALVTINACNVEGGIGGSTMSVLGDFGGNGGTAVRVFSGGEVIITGTPAHEILGGFGGAGPASGDDGAGGDGIQNDGVVRISGAVALGGPSLDYIDGVPISGGGLLLTPIPDDPFMEVVGEVRAGQPLQFVIHGEPGGVVRLLAGRGPIIANAPGSPDPRLTQPFRSIWIGNLPASGELVHSINLPSGMSSGDRFVLQSKITTGAGDRLTNSGVLLVR